MVLITPATGSHIDGPNGRDRTGTGLSTMIVMKVNGTPIGAIQRINIREERGLAMIDEVGTDGHIDSAPQRSTNITGDCTRVRFDRLRVTEAFSRDFLHAHAQRIPFDIDIFDNWNGDGGNAIITTVRNVWIASLGYTYQADNFIITDEMSFQAEAIYSTLNGGNAATGGERGANIMQLNSIERQADLGQRRGGVDAPNLIGDFFSNV
jgi:hypothetical protein